MIVGALGAVLALSVASAQEARPEPGSAPLELKRAAPPARPIVRPDSDRQQATRDAAATAAEYEQARRDEALMREQTRPALRRPDLGYDVTGSIQQRNIQRR
ncbi:MAG: hypothetical protein ACREK4_01975 [Candidatus Rokuibacteriota bacterium]